MTPLLRYFEITQDQRSARYNNDSHLLLLNQAIILEIPKRLLRETSFI